MTKPHDRVSTLHRHGLTRVGHAPAYLIPSSYSAPRNIHHLASVVLILFSASFHPSPSSISSILSKTMHITFVPALGSRTRVPVGSLFSLQDKDGIGAAFTARLSPQDYIDAVRTGLRIEIWTNAPSGMRPAGEWGAIAFDEVTETAPAHDGCEIEPQLSLIAEVSSQIPSPVDSTTKQHVFRAPFSLPRMPGSAFSFTYRLVYPGGICWLGSDRDNGELELVPSSAFFFEQYGTWDFFGERALVGRPGLEHAVEEEESLLIGKLDIDEWTWTGWATDGLRVWSFSDNHVEAIKQARLAFLIPAVNEKSILLQRNLVLRTTSDDTPFSINSQGQVLLRSNGQGTFIYRAHDVTSERDLERLRSEIMSSCSAPRILGTKNTEVILFTPNYDSETSVTIYAQSLTQRSTPCRSVLLPIAALDSFVKHSTLLSFFNPETRSTLFVGPSDYSGELALRCGTSGVQVVISAVYDLADASLSCPGWQFALPTYAVPAEHLVMSNQLENLLPTPPASPQARPQRTVSFVLPFEGDAENELRQRKPTDTSLSASQKSGEAWRPLRSDYNLSSASSGEKIKVMIFSALKMVARLIGATVLRFILFAFRLLGGKQSEDGSHQSGGNHAKTNADKATPSLFKNELESEEVKGMTSSETVETQANSSLEKNTVGTPPTHWRSAFSTTECVDDDRGLDQRESSGSKLPTPVSRPMSQSLRWVLPVGDATPFTLLVRSDVAPEDVSKHLCIELNGEDTWAKGSSTIYCVGDKTSVVEIAPPQGKSQSSTLLVKLRA